MTESTMEKEFCALSEIKVHFVMGPRDLKKLRSALGGIIGSKRPVGVDTETTGLDPLVNQVRLLQIASAEEALVIDLDGFRASPRERQVDWDQPGLNEVAEFLRSRHPKVLQNASFDFNFLRAEGIAIGGLIFDTLFAAKIRNNGSGSPNNLGAIVRRELGEEMPKELQKADWSGEIDMDMLEYAARDACCLPRLVKPLREKLLEARVSPSVTLNDVFELELACLRPVALMQAYGFPFNKKAAEELREELIRRENEGKLELLVLLDRTIRELHPDDESKWLPREPDGNFNTRERTSGSIRLGTKVYAGFNPRSNPQMAQKFEDAGILLPPNKKGLPSLDQNLLAFLQPDYPLIDLYLKWKEKATRVSCIEKLLNSIGPDGRIHARYNQMGADTGRFSCSEPNLQQVPREAEFRSLFQASPGWSFVVADFSQVELRTAAELSGEERMLEAYAAGRDLHTETAALMTGKSFEDVTKSERQSAKVANFGLLYGAGPTTLRKQAVAQYGLDMSIEEATEIVRNFRKAYPRLYEWQKEVGDGTTAAVFTRYGRRRMMVGFSDKYTTRINTQVQGTAGDIAKISIAKLWETLQHKTQEARLIAMVHDELVLEVRDDVVDKWAKALQDCMQSAGALVCRRVPIVAEVSSGKSWADAK